MPGAHGSHLHQLVKLTPRQSELFSDASQLPADIVLYMVRLWRPFADLLCSGQMQCLGVTRKQSSASLDIFADRPAFRITPNLGITWGEHAISGNDWDELAFFFARCCRDIDFDDGEDIMVEGFMCRLVGMGANFAPPPGELLRTDPTGVVKNMFDAVVMVRCVLLTNMARSSA